MLVQGLTSTVTFPKLRHPLVPYELTEYTVLPVGETEIDEEVVAVVEADNTADSPTQIKVGLAVAEIGVPGTTATLHTAVDVQPAKLAPVMVYVVLTVGETTAEPPEYV